jgi:hypothetical protein
LLVIVSFGVAGRKHRLFSVLPELICYRHGHLPVRPVPISSCAPWQQASGQNCSLRLPVHRGADSEEKHEPASDIEILGRISRQLMQGTGAELHSVVKEERCGTPV